jgi:AraC-like DNA-binding protein
VDNWPPHDRIDWRLRRARDFIYSAYAQPLDLPTISKEAQLSPFHFLRSFRSAFELTPHKYLTHLRIERAKELLASEHLPITEVCFEVGFESLGSFSTLFTRHVGESPSAFRRRVNRLFRSAAMFSTLGIPHCFLYWFGHPP